MVNDTNKIEVGTYNFIGGDGMGTIRGGALIDVVGRGVVENLGGGEGLSSGVVPRRWYDRKGMVRLIAV